MCTSLSRYLQRKSKVNVKVNACVSSMQLRAHLQMLPLA